MKDSRAMVTKDVCNVHEVPFWQLGPMRAPSKDPRPLGLPEICTAAHLMDPQRHLKARGGIRTAMRTERAADVEEAQDPDSASCKYLLLSLSLMSLIWPGILGSLPRCF